MTIETLNAIKTETYNLNSGMITLSEKFTDYELAGGIVPEDIDTAFNSMLNGLDIIRVWVAQAIEDGTVEEPQLEAMAMFLLEIKAVFEKYSAVLNVINGEGYGAESYGTNYGGADVIRFTVTDPVSGQVTTKEFIQTSLSAGDL